MPVELSIIESVTELETTVVEVVLESASAPGPAGPGVPTGGTVNQVLTKDSSTDYDTSWQDPTGGAPDDVDYLVGTASGSLSAEIVVGTSPGGELGGTWASPTVDATHSGSSHAGVQAAAEATAAAALSAHESDTTGIHGIADTSALETTAGAQAKVDTHVNDTSAAHAASAISFTPNGSIAATDVQAAIQEVRDEAGGGGAPTDVDYLVGTASGGLSAEIVVGATPGGELGGTWASPTVDATHSGSSHAGVQAAAEATAAAALSAHVTDTSAAHAASAVSADSTTLSGTGTDVQAVLEELDNLLDDHSARHENGGADEISVAGLSGKLADAQPVTVKDDGTPVGTRSGINFHEGSNVTLTIADDAGNDEVDVTIAAAGGGATDADDVSVADVGGLYAGTDVEAVFAEIGAWQTYTPTLTGSGSNPNLGAGGSISGRYLKIGKLVIVLARADWAGAGASAGSGTYAISLPVAVGAGFLYVGSVLCFDGTTFRTGVCEPNHTNQTTQMITHGATARVASNVPQTWKANDLLSISLIYVAA